MTWLQLVLTMTVAQSVSLAGPWARALLALAVLAGIVAAEFYATGGAGAIPPAAHQS
jgi:hypothetical protein